MIVIDRCFRTHVRASFTVEASLLMSIILPALISLIIGGFYVHDRALVQSAACELAAMGSNLHEYDQASSKLSALKDQLTGSGYLWAGSIRGSVSVSARQSLSQVSGTFPVPALVSALLGNPSVMLKGRCVRQIYRPAGLIRKVRGAAELWSD